MAAKNEMFELLVRLTGDNDGATSTLKELRDEVKKLETEFEQTQLGSKEFDDLKKKIDTTKRAIKELTTEAKKPVEPVVEVKPIIDLSNTIDGVRQELKQAEADLSKIKLGTPEFDAAKKKVIDLRKEVVNLQQGLKDTPAAIVPVDNSLEAMKAELAAVTAQMQKLDVGSDQFRKMSENAVLLRRRIQDLSQPTDTMIRSTKSAQNVALNLNRVIQDMPYGILGIANNVDMLQESLIRLSKEQGGVKAGFTALMGAMMGPSGIMMAVSLVTALVVAFGDDLVRALTKGEEKVEDLDDRLAGLQQYRNFDLEIRIHGSAGLEKLKLEMLQLLKIKGFLEDSAKWDAEVEKARKARNNAVSNKNPLEVYAGSRMQETVNYERLIQEAEARRTKNYRQLALLVKAGTDSFGTYDLKLLTEYAGMSEEAAKKRIAAIQTAQKIEINRIEQNEQAIKDYEKAGKGYEQEMRRREAAEKKAQALAEKNARLAEKQAIELAQQQETLYSSMLSNIEQALNDDLITLEMAMTGLRQGPIADRYNTLLAHIDQTISTMLDGAIRAELQAIRAKLATGRPLTGENVKFLEAYGGLDANQAGFLGKASAIGAKTPQSRRDSWDLDGNNRRSFSEMGKEWKDSAETIGEDFEDTATGAFDTAVSQFSAQLAQAIFQGGATFSEILGNVATVFGQMLMQFVIEALAKQALGGLFGIFADGASAAPPGYAWVGERGPELVRMTGGEEVVPNNQVNRRLNALHDASGAAADAFGSSDITGIIAALNKQTKALLAERLNYQITSAGNKEIAKATKRRDTQIKRYTGG